MSFATSAKSSAESSTSILGWFTEVLGVDNLDEGYEFSVGGQPFIARGGVPRSCKLMSDEQAQTSETFGFKWKKIDTFDSPVSLTRMREWLVERYGDLATASWLAEHGERPLLIDAGCGAGMSGLELLGPILPRIRYLGIDVSEAVDVARQRFAERGFICGFIQADINDLPLSSKSVDLIFSEGVLHHTDSTEDALKSLARLLKPGGRFLFYLNPAIR